MITVAAPNGATVDFPDGTDANTIDSVMRQHFHEDKPSGVVAGAVQGVSDVAGGINETLKNFAGTNSPVLDKVANASAVKDYVPANPRHISEWPQLIAENTPSYLTALASGATGKAIGSAMSGKNPKAAAIAGLAAAAAAMWAQNAGKSSKSDAVERTGNPDATPETQDLVRGGLTSAASAAIGSAPLLRLLPGANKIGTVGAQGAIDAMKKYGTTVAANAGGSAAANAVDQLGNTGTYDPQKGVDAGITGGVMGGALAGPRAAADVSRAHSYSEFGGANTDATAGLAKRLADSQRLLGKSTEDFDAMRTVRANLQNELGDTAKAVNKQAQLSPDADNALQRAKSGQPLTMADVDLINRETAGTPDGANATHLARQAYLAQQLQKKGSYDQRAGQWSGGFSGIMDKNLPWLANPAKVAVGTAATAAGIHLLGTASPLFAASGYGAYLGSRMVDSLTGARSPAKTFVDHFNQLNAQTRLPTAQPPAAPPAPPTPPAPGPAQPWGPVPPASGPTGPQVAPPAAPQAPTPGTQPWKAPQVTQLPQFNPVAMAQLAALLKSNPHAQTPPAPPAPPPAPAPEKVLSDAAKQADTMWKQKQYLESVKTKSAPAPEPQAAPAPAAPITPGTAPWAKPQVTELPQFNPTAVAMLQKQLKAGLPAPAENTPAIPAQPAANAAAPKSMADVLASVTAAQAAPTAPKKITKTDGKVETSAPALTQATADASDPYGNRAAYRPIPDDQLSYKGMDHSDIASSETQAHMADKPDIVQERYKNRILDALETKGAIHDEMSKEHPESASTVEALMHQLNQRSGDREIGKDAIAHYAGLLSPEAGTALKAKFNENAMRRIYETSKERRAREGAEKKANGSKAKGRQARKDKGSAEVQKLAAE